MKCISILNRHEYSGGASPDCDGLREVDSDHCEPLDLETELHSMRRQA